MFGVAEVPSGRTAATPRHQVGKPFGPGPVEALLAHEQHTPCPIERGRRAGPVAGLFGLDAPADRVEATVGERHGMEGVDHLEGFGQ